MGEDLVEDPTTVKGVHKKINEVLLLFLNGHSPFNTSLQNVPKILCWNI